MIVNAIKYTNYAFKKQNKPESEINMNCSDKKDSVSFGAIYKKTIETMPKIKGVYDLILSIMEMPEGEELSQIQIAKLKEIYDGAMAVIKDDVKPGRHNTLIKVFAQDQNQNKADIFFDGTSGYLDTRHKYNPESYLELGFDKDGSLFSFLCRLFDTKGHKRLFEDNKLEQIV